MLVFACLFLNSTNKYYNKCFALLTLSQLQEKIASLENTSLHFANQPRPAKFFASSLGKFFLFQLFHLWQPGFPFVMIYQKIDITHPSFREIFLNDCSFEYSQLSSVVCRTNTRKYNFQVQPSTGHLILKWHL